MQWKGYGPEDNTVEDALSLANTQQLEDYLTRNIRAILSRRRSRDGKYTYQVSWKNRKTRTYLPQEALEGTPQFERYLETAGL